MLPKIMINMRLSVRNKSFQTQQRIDFQTEPMNDTLQRLGILPKDAKNDGCVVEIECTWMLDSKN